MQLPAGFVFAPKRLELPLAAAVPFEDPIHRLAPMRWVVRAPDPLTFKVVSHRQNSGFVARRVWGSLRHPPAQPQPFGVTYEHCQNVAPVPSDRLYLDVSSTVSIGSHWGGGLGILAVCLATAPTPLPRPQRALWDRCARPDHLARFPFIGSRMQAAQRHRSGTPGEG